MNSIKILIDYFSLPRSAKLQEHLRKCYAASAHELIAMAILREYAGVVGEGAGGAGAVSRFLADSSGDFALRLCCDVANADAGAKAVVSRFLAGPERDFALRLLRSRAPSDLAYPDGCEVFRAFAGCLRARVLILGQDPYHDGCACGLAFASRGKLAPSLRTIARELALERDFGAALGEMDAKELAKSARDVADLSECALQKWAQQGVMLLNVALTVAPHEAGSHAAVWADFTEFVLARLRPSVAMLWGAQAQKYAGALGSSAADAADAADAAEVRTSGCAILCAAHPSPLARGKFYGCGHFLKANEILRGLGEAQIEWI